MQKAWAVDDLIVNDAEDAGGDLFEAGTIVSALQGGIGLPSSPAVLAQRYGRWPLVSGIGRPGRKLALTTLFLQVGTSERQAQRRQLLQALNPEMETARRLWVADHVLPGVAPKHVLLATGQWDVRREPAGWLVRDLLRPDEVQGTLTGGFRVFPAGGMQFAEETTNCVRNPIFEHNVTDGWTVSAGGGSGAERDSSRAWIGSGSCKLHAGSGADSSISDSSTLLGLGLTASVQGRIWRDTAVGCKLVIWDATNSQERANVTPSLLGGWEHLMCSWTNTTGGAVNVQLRVVNTEQDNAAAIWIDGCQKEVKTYCTPLAHGGLGPGHSWQGTAHDSASDRMRAFLQVPTAVCQVDFTEGSEGTIVLWLQRNWGTNKVGPGGGYVLDAHYSASNRVSILWSSSLRWLDLGWNGNGNNDLHLVDAYTWPEGFWSMAAITWDFSGSSRNVTFHVFGPTGVSTQVFEDADPLAANPGTLLIGDAATTNASWDAMVDDALVLGRALTLDELSTVHSWGRGEVNARYLEVLCESADPYVVGSAPTGQGIVATLAVHGDVRCRQRRGDAAVWHVDEGTGEAVVDNAGDDDAYPTLLITPKAAKSTGYAYRRWVPILWRAESSATSYPTLLGPFDTATLVTAGKAQADGDDWRVRVDGSEVDRWFGTGAAAFNQATTKTWINLDFAPSVSLTLKTAIAASGAVEAIDVNESITAVSAPGTVVINSEAFTYTSKSNSLRRFTGVTREAKGTTAALHTAGATVDWIQHDVWILYGNSSVGAPSQDDDTKPILNLTSSTNGSWVYAEFGENDGLRTGAWSRVAVYDSPTFYGGNHATSADPWAEMGICILSYPKTGSVEGRGQVYNPCGITQAAFTNGEKYALSVIGDWGSKGPAKIQYSADGSAWDDDYVIPAPSAPSTWEAWSRTFTASQYVPKYVAIRLAKNASDTMGAPYVECADVTLTLDSGTTPTHSIGDEQGNYSLECTITNATTGDAIELDLTMALDQTLEVDTDEKRVTLLDDSSSQVQALTLVGGARRDWLRLVPGENELEFEDAGTVELEILLLWDRRLFE